ncbi:hypothetical protein AV530_000182 [Patagioenas fasciata monilis]|uniref:Uncharacterized protein n=1 Tax=Patagioenas fasciata monilis TaxID=372326 RepID=A0A1V4K9A6_PATFA|nr:hypothetical protein AV530_000182 [Patagioenas fasciata monilis]
MELLGSSSKAALILRIAREACLGAAEKENIDVLQLFCVLSRTENINNTNFYPGERRVSSKGWEKPPEAPGVERGWGSTRGSTPFEGRFLTRATESSPAAAAACAASPGTPEPTRGAAFASCLLSNKGFHGQEDKDPPRTSGMTQKLRLREIYDEWIK